MSAGSKDNRWKTPKSPSGGCLSVKSNQSIEPPLLFKGKHEKEKGSIYTPSPSERSSKDIPLHFRKNHEERPDADYSTYETDSSSKEIPLHFDKKKKVPYGMPQSWGGHVDFPVEPQRLKVQCPPAAVYPIHDIPRRVSDGVIHRSLSRENREKTKSTFSSDTSDYPSTQTSGSSGSQHHFGTDLHDYIEEGVTCEICSQASAVKTCLTCNTSYCEADVRQHYTVKSLRRHVLTDACEELEGKRCLHYSKCLDFFCRTDQMRICSICAQGCHMLCDIISLRPCNSASQRSGDDGDHNPGLPYKVVPSPGKIKFLTVKPNSVVLSWGSPVGLEGPKNFRLKWSSLTKVEGGVVIKDFHKIEINNLQFGQKYFFSVATEDEDGNLSQWITASVLTMVPAPQHVSKGHSEATALSLKWTKGDNMEGIQHQYLITVTSPGKDPLAIYTEYCYKIFSDLEPDTEYVVSVSTVLNDQCSEAISINIHTEPCLREVLSKIGLEDQYVNKLSLCSALEISQFDTAENKFVTAKSLPETFLKKLMILNAHARNIQFVSCDGDADRSDAINPLDMIVALFLCSDGFLQQDIVLKMALCQFAIPLVLPNHDTREITLLLWSMREIVKTFRPSNQAFRKLSCERIVLSNIPLVSFVRLGRTTLSKSQMLNKLLSNTQQCHDTFYHRGMACGEAPRRISDGLVEISWYLPCGNKNIDKFTEPLSVANLRGDIRAFEKQFSFLCRTSALVYIFCNESELDYIKNLEGKDVKATIILISIVQGKTFTLKMLTIKPSLKTTNLSQKKKTETELAKALQESISKMLENCPKNVSMAQWADSARWSGILIDEDSDECQSARKNVSKITPQIANSSDFKDQHLTSQGHIWKELSWLETEYWRLRKAGKRKIDEYRKFLKRKEMELRKKQMRFEMTTAMSTFLHGVVTSEVQRYYFLKWLEMDLDNLSRNQLLSLLDRYKELSLVSPQDAEKIAEIDKQISGNVLHLGHFFRECGQLYEYSSYLPEFSRQRKTMEQLPGLCAQMLLDGFPLELVDGESANIPMKWITEVLTELHYIMQSNSKLKVISIIGAESSGKSTLLNTMFGVRFAVGRGTCTRGAFIQLIIVNKDLREELGCDCIVIIDTEGLKPHQMVQDDDSHERDEEVASLAVALSDAVIISVSRSDACERDTLEMVLHSCTRLKEVGKKPRCYFLHNHMTDMPAVEKRNNEEFLEQLKDVIQKDARMKKANLTKISEVMEIDSDRPMWHFPPVWHGTPPMAPFSLEYSETADALKKRLIWDLRQCQGRGDLTHFITQVEGFWKAL